MTHHPSAASLRLHGARLLFPPAATLLSLVLTEYIARGALSGDTFVQYIFPHPDPQVDMMLMCFRFPF